MTTKAERRKQNLEAGTLRPKKMDSMPPTIFDRAERKRRRKKNKDARASRRANR